MKNDPRPCSNCSGLPAAAVTQRFTDSSAAFGYHTRLVLLGLDPSLCMRRDGTLHVCHGLGRQAAQAVESPVSTG